MAYYNTIRNLIVGAIAGGLTTLVWINWVN